MFNGYHRTTTSSTTHSSEVCKSLEEIYVTFQLVGAAHWAETDYGLSAGQHAVLPKGKGKGKGGVRCVFVW